MEEKVTIKKQDALNILEKFLSHHSYGSDVNLPRFDQVVKEFKYEDGSCDVWTFRGLLMIAYDLEDAKD